MLHNKVNFEWKPSRLFPNFRISEKPYHSPHVSHLLAKTLRAEGEALRKMSTYLKMYLFQVQAEDIHTDNQDPVQEGAALCTVYKYLRPAKIQVSFKFLLQQSVSRPAPVPQCPQGYMVLPKTLLEL